jgi:hypothetical protein
MAYTDQRKPVVLTYPAEHSNNKRNRLAETGIRKKWHVRALITYRGITVYPWHSGALFVIDSIVITERAIFTGLREKAKRVIDDFVDGTTKTNSCAYHAFERMRDAHTEGLQLLKDNPE